MSTTTSLTYPSNDEAHPTELSSAIGTGDTSVPVGKIQATPPTPYLALIAKPKGKRELVEVTGEDTSTSPPTLTVNRGMKSTTAKAFDSKDSVFLGVQPADVFDELGGATFYKQSGVPTSSLGSDGDFFASTSVSNGVMNDLISFDDPTKASAIADVYDKQFAVGVLDEANDEFIIETSYSTGKKESRAIPLTGGFGEIVIKDDGTDFGSFSDLNLRNNISADASGNIDVDKSLPVSEKGSSVDDATSIDFDKGLHATTDGSGNVTVDKGTYTGFSEPNQSLGGEGDYYVKDTVTNGLINPLATHGPIKTSDMVDTYSTASEQIVLATVDETNDDLIFEVSYSDGTRKNARISLT